MRVLGAQIILFPQILKDFIKDEVYWFISTYGMYNGQTAFKNQPK